MKRLELIKLIKAFKREHRTFNINFDAVRFKVEGNLVVLQANDAQFYPDVYQEAYITNQRAESIDLAVMLARFEQLVGTYKDEDIQLSQKEDKLIIRADGVVTTFDCCIPFTTGSIDNSTSISNVPSINTQSHLDKSTPVPPKSLPPLLTPKYEEALAFTARLFTSDVRKGTQIPYISHLLAVSGLVMEFGGTEEEAIAALLHDALEDKGPSYRWEIRHRFGAKVLQIVEGCSDSLTDPRMKADWRQRKETYLTHLEACTDPSIHLVSAADKLHNARTILTDLRINGIAVFERFKGGQDGTLWYYSSLHKTYQNAGLAPKSLLQELELVLDALTQLT